MASAPIDYGFEHRLPDACVFQNTDPRDRSIVQIILLRRIDRIIVAESDSHMIDLEGHLKKFFKINLLGELVQYSGCSFVRVWEKGT